MILYKYRMCAATPSLSLPSIALFTEDVCKQYIDFQNLITGAGNR